MEWHQVGDILRVCFGKYEIGLIYSNLKIDWFRKLIYISKLTDLNFHFFQIVSHNGTVSRPIEENLNNNQDVLIKYRCTDFNTKYYFYL